MASLKLQVKSQPLSHMPTHNRRNQVRVTSQVKNQMLQSNAGQKSFLVATFRKNYMEILLKDTVNVVLFLLLRH